MLNLLKCTNKSWIYFRRVLCDVGFNCFNDELAKSTFALVGHLVRLQSTLVRWRLAVADEVKWLVATVAGRQTTLWTKTKLTATRVRILTSFTDYQLQLFSVKHFLKLNYNSNSNNNVAATCHSIIMAMLIHAVLHKNVYHNISF